MAKKRIFRQQLRTWSKETQSLCIGDNTILHAHARNDTFIDVWFEDNYDRQDHLPELRNFKVIPTNGLVPARYTYVTTAVVAELNLAFHIYREDQDE